MRNTLQCCLAAILCAGLASGPGTAAWAQGTPSADAIQQAKEHFERGVRMYQEDDFRGALIEFNRAYEIAPNWAVLYDIGQAQYQLRDYAAALRTLERYTKEGGERMPPDRKAQVDREVVELRGRVAHVTILANVQDADVSLDDLPFGKAPTSEPVLISAGRHKLVLSHPGFGAGTQVVDIAGGDNVTLRFDLQPEAQALPVVPVERPSPNYTAAIVAGTVGLAGIAVGTVFGVLTLNSKSTLDGECNSAKVCNPGSQNDIDAYTRNGSLSGIGFGVGIVGLGLATYAFLHERGKESGPAPAAKLRVTPWITPGLGGLTGTF